MSTPRDASAPDRILQRLDWQVIRRLDGLLQGNYRTLFYGQGVDFVDLREYQPADDIRAIDWNVTARMDTPYVRQYAEDREISAWFLLDLSPSMEFGGLRAQKRAVLTDVVATLARLLTRHGNRVGAIFYGDGVERTVPARGGRMQVLRLIDDLTRRPALPRSAPTALGSLLQAGLQSIRRRALIFVVSDFISAPGWERQLKLLSQRHEVLAVRVWDPRERELPDVGPIIMEDAETGEQLYVDTSNRRFRERFRAAAERREAEVAAGIKGAGVETLALSTEEDLVRAIVGFAALRQRRRRR
jgi:uncharacterized protein (DUF58 family)